LVGEWLDRIEDGRLKLFITQRGLTYRRNHPGLLSGGDYLPVECRGEREDHVFAYARRRQLQWMLVAVPRLITSLPLSKQRAPLGPGSWSDTSLSLPDDGPREWRNLLTKETVHVRGGKLQVSDAFCTLPVAIFVPASA
jgi:(1->4)-alpha-D-glucan 1-alpha-D-glucosylmutase